VRIDEFWRHRMAAGKVVAGTAPGAARGAGTERLGARTGLVGGALSALGAAVCCLGPLVLVSIGVTGAWIGNLGALTPYRWIFITAALAFMGLAWHRIYRQAPAAACEPGAACALPQASRAQRVAFWLIAMLVLAAIGYPYLLPFFY
jgi:mercuric ion transport protein